MQCELNLSERSQPQKAAYCKVLFIKLWKQGQPYIQISGCLGAGVKIEFLNSVCQAQDVKLFTSLKSNFIACKYTPRN